MSVMTERLLWEVQLQKREQSLESGTDADALPAESIGKPTRASIIQETRSASTKAQDLAYQAMEAGGEESLRLALQALQLDPDCSDAQVIVADFAQTPAESTEMLLGALKTAEAKLPENCLSDEQYAGQFWSSLETRPYMRARERLAWGCYLIGDRMGAIANFRELLRLNPKDNQGIRYELAPMLVAAGHDSEAADLLATYSDEISSTWLYLSALLLYRAEGATPTAEKAMRRAFRANPNVLMCIATDDPCEPPETFGIGDLDEAVVIVRAQHDAWAKSPGFVEWMLQLGLEELGDQMISAVAESHCGLLQRP